MLAVDGAHSEGARTELSESEKCPPCLRHYEAATRRASEALNCFEMAI
jgi:hypothetical protein